VNIIHIHVARSGACTEAYTQDFEIKGRGLNLPKGHRARESGGGSRSRTQKPTADWAAWLPGTCQVVRLARRPGGPQRQMLQDKGARGP